MDSVGLSHFSPLLRGEGFDLQCVYQFWSAVNLLIQSLVNHSPGIQGTLVFELLRDHDQVVVPSPSRDFMPPVQVTFVNNPDMVSPEFFFHNLFDQINGFHLAPFNVPQGLEVWKNVLVILQNAHTPVFHLNLPERRGISDKPEFCPVYKL